MGYWHGEGVKHGTGAKFFDKKLQEMGMYYENNSQNTHGHAFAPHYFAHFYPGNEIWQYIFVRRIIKFLKL